MKGTEFERDGRWRGTGGLFLRGEVVVVVEIEVMIDLDAEQASTAGVFTVNEIGLYMEVSGAIRGGTTQPQSM